MQMDDNRRMAALLFPHITKTAEQYLTEIYPPRQLPEGAMVTRFAPSPTGFLHIGGVFTALVCERLAHQSGGVCFLRIEDTDKKREQQDGVSGIIRGLSAFGIDFDEGVMLNGEEKGAYGPYVQSHRAEIYQCFCKELVEKGLAYPCFCTEEELADIRAQQEVNKVLPGYHGEYARCRSLTVQQVEEKIAAGQPYVVRLRSPGKPGGRIKLRDAIRGEIEMDENIADIVLLKRDGIPTYHFAHVVDDTLMGTTHVVRGDEWVSSAPIHLQLFYVLGLKPPRFAHVSPIMKEEDGSRRKLSKRKDPEASVEYFVREGYPADAVVEYLLTLLNSNFEDWRKQNKTADCREFPFSLKKMSQSGALFDLLKLDSVSSAVISRMTAEQVLEQSLAWAGQYDKELYDALAADKDYARGIFAIDRGGAKPRKDIAKWSDVRQYVSYFYDGMDERQSEPVTNVAPADQAEILRAYLAVMDTRDDKDTWFEKIRTVAGQTGFCPDVKQYKADPTGYKGHVGDVSAVLRAALTGRKNTPDLHAIMALLGQEKCVSRINQALEAIINGK